MATTPPNVTFASGGVVVGGGVIRINSVANGNWTTLTQTIDLGPVPERQPLCNQRRGGPDSKIKCEIFKVVPHTTHWGRGKRKWYSWD